MNNIDLCLKQFIKLYPKKEKNIATEWSPIVILLALCLKENKSFRTMDIKKKNQIPAPVTYNVTCSFSHTLNLNNFKKIIFH